MTTPIRQLRRRILKRAGVVPEPGTKRMVPVDELPDIVPKTDRMRLLESRHNIKIEHILFNGSLNDVRKRLNWEVDRSTISKWRKMFRRYLGIPARRAKVEQPH